MLELQHAVEAGSLGEVRRLAKRAQEVSLPGRTAWIRRSPKSRAMVRLLASHADCLLPLGVPMPPRLVKAFVAHGCARNVALADCVQFRAVDRVWRHVCPSLKGCREQSLGVIADTL